DLEQRAGRLVMRRPALQQGLELRLRAAVVLGHVVALAQPVGGVGGVGASGVQAQELAEEAGRALVVARAQGGERGLVGGALVGGVGQQAGVAEHRGGGLRGRGRGRGARGGRRAPVRRRGRGRRGGLG